MALATSLRVSRGSVGVPSFLRSLRSPRPVAQALQVSTGCAKCHHRVSQPKCSWICQPTELIKEIDFPSAA